MFKEVILYNQNLIKNIKTIKRDYVFYDDLLKLNKIVSFVWPRRVGKTFLMIDFVKELIRNGKIELEQVVFIDFSLNTGETIDFRGLLIDFKELYPEKEPFFVFDEIQDIANFKEFVLSLYNLGYRIFLSGSNSKLLSVELSTHFRWRVFEYRVFPLTFREALRFKNVEYKRNYALQELGVIKNILREMLEFGAFPEILLSENDLFKIDNLKTYLDVLLYKDLIERYQIENEVSLKYLVKSIALAFSKDININKTYNELKSLNIKIGKTTLYEYYEYLKNVFYAYELENFYNQKASKKVFLYNTWFQKILTSKENRWQAFENAVLLELLKRYDKVYFKRNGSEIDFCIPEAKMNIQVCHELTNDNLKREAGAFDGSDERNIIVYFTKNITVDMGDTFELMDFIEFTSILNP